MAGAKKRENSTYAKATLAAASPLDIHERQGLFMSIARNFLYYIIEVIASQVAAKQAMQEKLAKAVRKMSSSGSKSEVSEKVERSKEEMKRLDAELEKMQSFEQRLNSLNEEIAVNVIELRTIPVKAIANFFRNQFAPKTVTLAGIAAAAKAAGPPAATKAFKPVEQVAIGGGQFTIVAPLAPPAKGKPQQQYILMGKRRISTGGDLPAKVKQFEAAEALLTTVLPEFTRTVADDIESAPSMKVMDKVLKPKAAPDTGSEDPDLDSAIAHLHRTTHYALILGVRSELLATRGIAAHITNTYSGDSYEASLAPLCAELLTAGLQTDPNFNTMMQLTFTQTKARAKTVDGLINDFTATATKAQKANTAADDTLTTLAKRLKAVVEPGEAPTPTLGTTAKP